VSKIDHTFGAGGANWLCHHTACGFPSVTESSVAPISEDNGGCYDKLCINFPCVRRDFRSLLRCNLGILVCGTVAGSECSTLVKTMPDVDVLLSQIARAYGFAAAMIDTAIRKRFELMVAEFQRELDAIEEHPVSQRDSDED
jgi:hypothetical protein